MLKSSKIFVRSTVSVVKGTGTGPNQEEPQMTIPRMRHDRHREAQEDGGSPLLPVVEEVAHNVQGGGPLVSEVEMMALHCQLGSATSERTVRCGPTRGVATIPVQCPRVSNATSRKLPFVPVPRGTTRICSMRRIMVISSALCT